MKKLYSLLAVAMFSAAAFAQTVAFDFGAQGYSNAQEISSGTIDPNVTFTTAKNSSGTAPTYYTSGTALRFYAESGTGDGNSLTLIPASGKKITDLVINSVSTTYTLALTYSVDGGTPIALTASGTSYTISGISATSSLTIKNAVTGATTQLRITTLSVTYTSSLAVNDLTTIPHSFVKNTSVNNEINFGTKADVKIFSMNGQMVKSASVSENKNLEVSDLAPGMYIVTGMVNGQAVSTKIVKK